MSRRSFAISATPALSFRRQGKPVRLPVGAMPWLFLAGDAVIIVLAAVIAEVGYHVWVGGEGADLQRSLGLGGVAALLFVTLQQANGLYLGIRHTRLLRHARDAFTSWLIVFAAVMSLLFLLKSGEAFSRAVVMVFFGAGYAGLLSWRVLVRRICLRLVTAGSLVGPRAALLVEYGCADVASQLSRLRRAGYRITRIFMLPDSDDQDAAGAAAESALSGLVRHVREQDVNEILVLASWRCIAANSDIHAALRMVPVPVKLVADQRLSRILAYPGCDVAGSRGMLLKPSALGPLQRLGKRVFDMIVASVLLIVLSPVFAVAAIAIRLDSPGPVLFRQWRGGFNGRRFRICKFRTMRVAEDGASVKQATRGDARVTRVGRWLRASSIDELPQLFNVLRGDMSLVGPRPHAILHDVTYAAFIEPYPARHNVKPGITGWAQVQGFRGETTNRDQMKRRVEHDLTYIENWSFMLDVLIVGLTVREVLRPRNAY